MRIVFDLDGVIRDINGYLTAKFGVPYPQEWFWKYQDKDIFGWIEADNFAPLVYAPTTDYYWIVKYCFEKPEFWTDQPERWKPLTKLWLDVHFQNYELKYLNNEQKRETLDNNPETWLVEDCPLFSHWDRIVLINQPYNKHIKEAERISNLSDLDKWLWRMLEIHKEVQV